MITNRPDPFVSLNSVKRCCYLPNCRCFYYLNKSVSEKSWSLFSVICVTHILLFILVHSSVNPVKHCALGKMCEPLIFLDKTDGEVRKSAWRNYPSSQEFGAQIVFITKIWENRYQYMTFLKLLERISIFRRFSCKFCTPSSLQ